MKIPCISTSSRAQEGRSIGNPKTHLSKLQKIARQLSSCFTTRLGYGASRVTSMRENNSNSTIDLTRCNSIDDRTMEQASMTSGQSFIPLMPGKTFHRFARVPTTIIEALKSNPTDSSLAYKALHPVTQDTAPSCGIASIPYEQTNGQKSANIEGRVRPVFASSVEEVAKAYEPFIFESESENDIVPVKFSVTTDTNNPAAGFFAPTLSAGYDRNSYLLSPSNHYICTNIELKPTLLNQNGVYIVHLTGYFKES